MLALLSTLAFADDPPKSPLPTRVTAAAADVHLELPAGFVRWTDGAKTVTLRGTLTVDLYDGWALIRDTTTGQIHTVPRERMIYAGTNPPDSL